jgi:hypothetical protein
VAATGGGARRRAAVVWHGIELGGSVSCKEGTGRWRARWRTHIGQRGRHRSGGDGDGLDEAERRGDATPATTSRRYGPRGRQQAAPVASSSSCAALGQLLDGGEATTTENSCSGALGFRRLGREVLRAASVLAGLARGWRRP